MKIRFISSHHRRPKNVAINFVHCKRRRQRIVYIYSIHKVGNLISPDEYTYSIFCILQKSYARQIKLSCQPYVYYIYKQYAAAGACSARNLSRHFWAAYVHIWICRYLCIINSNSVYCSSVSCHVKRKISRLVLAFLRTEGQAYRKVTVHKTRMKVTRLI